MSLNASLLVPVHLQDDRFASRHGGIDGIATTLKDAIRRRVKEEMPWWVPTVIDNKIYQRIVTAIEQLLSDISTDPDHPVRATFDSSLRDFVHRLQHSPEAGARAEELKEEWLSDGAVADLTDWIWDATRRSVAGYAATSKSTTVLNYCGIGPDLLKASGIRPLEKISVLNVDTGGRLTVLSSISGINGRALSLAVDACGALYLALTRQPGGGINPIQFLVVKLAL